MFQRHLQDPNQEDSWMELIIFARAQQHPYVPLVLHLLLLLLCPQLQNLHESSWIQC